MAKLFFSLKNKKDIFRIVNKANCREIVFLGLGLSFNVRKHNYKKLINLPIQNNKIVFTNYAGKSYGCNPKYITEEILRQNLPYEIIWLVTDVEKERENFPQQVRLVPYYSKKALKELSSAKVIISNNRLNFFWQCGLPKKKEQLYIQTWHGSLGIKKIEGDIAKESPSWRKWAKVDSSYIDIFTSHSKFEDEHYQESFWYSGPIVRTNHPRNDIFFIAENEKIKIKDKVYKYLNIDVNKKIVLYVPTFRDDGDIKCYDIDADKVINTLNCKFNDDYIFLIRLHPNVNTENLNLIKNSVNATDYPDIQELLFASDIVISDYSSCMFDFMLTRKPVFIYASDIEKYNNERGFYYPLETTPFSIAQTNDELMKNIENFDNIEYVEKADKFLIDFDCTDDGKASENVVKIIKNFVEEGKNGK